MSDVNAVIDNLANKLGIASEVLIPAMTRYYIADDISTLIICAVIILAGIIFIINAVKKIKGRTEEFESDPWVVGIAGSSLIVVITFSVFFVHLTNLIGFIVSPTGATIDYILRYIK